MIENREIMMRMFPELFQSLNIQAVDNLAKLCHENNVKLIHISTDYVFDGEKKTPYDETDLTNLTLI